MSISGFSRGAVLAFNGMSEYTRKGNREARKRIQEELRGAGPSAETLALAARIYSEDWRNGWNEGHDDGSSPLSKANRYSEAAVNKDEKSWYAHWKKAYAKKFRARCKGFGEMEKALKSYERAKELIEKQFGLPDGGSPADKQNYLDLLIDHAETYVYLGRPEDAAKAIEDALKLYPLNPCDGEKPRREDWYDWALGFAKHQSKQYIAACGLLEPLLKHENANNDIRLLLAASEARAGYTQHAKKRIEEFHNVRKQLGSNLPNDREPRWTVQLELGCGAFPQGTPGEAHWAASLAMILEPGEPVKCPGDKGETPLPGRKAAAKKKVAKKKSPAVKPRGKVPVKAKKKAAAKKRSAKKVAKRPAKKAARKKSAARKVSKKKVAPKSRRR